MRSGAMERTITQDMRKQSLSHYTSLRTHISDLDIGKIRVVEKRLSHSLRLPFLSVSKKLRG